MLNELKKEANRTLTENGAATYRTTQSDCLDLFAAIGALRREDDKEIAERFARAYAEDPGLAMKILFYARDVRGGLGERRVFRTCLRWLAEYAPQSVRRNIARIAEYGRWDDLFILEGTLCESHMMHLIRRQMHADLAVLEANGNVSLLGKWMPSVNASCAKTVRRAKRFAKSLGMTEPEYRRALVKLRERIRIIENNLREKDYTFDYAAQPSKALFKYRAAFNRNDGERYQAYLDRVERGEEKMHTGTLAPYEIIQPILRGGTDEAQRRVIDVTWNAQEDFTGDENALAVIDGSGSMYCWNDPSPASVALSLGIYFAERNRGEFRNHFITFSETPQLVEIKGSDIAEKVRYCEEYNEVANTNIQKVFELILSAAVKNNVPQEEMPSALYIISDMEFDCCTEDASMTNFEYAKQLFAQHGYQLPRVVFWNVAARNRQQPVTQNEQGVVLVSGCTPRIFDMLKSGTLDPYAFMMQVLSSERYRDIAA